MICLGRSPVGHAVRGGGFVICIGRSHMLSDTLYVELWWGRKRWILWRIRVTRCRTHCTWRRICEGGCGRGADEDPFIYCRSYGMRVVSSSRVHEPWQVVRRLETWDRSARPYGVSYRDAGFVVRGVRWGGRRLVEGKIGGGDRRCVSWRERCGGDEEKIGGVDLGSLFLNRAFSCVLGLYRMVV